MDAQCSELNAKCVGRAEQFVSCVGIFNVFLLISHCLLLHRISLMNTINQSNPRRLSISDLVFRCWQLIIFFRVLNEMIFPLIFYEGPKSILWILCTACMIVKSCGTFRPGSILWQKNSKWWTDSNRWCSKAKKYHEMNEKNDIKRVEVAKV